MTRSTARSRRSTRLNNTTTYSYDALDRMVSMTDALGRVTTYAYDADSRLVGETWYASGGTVTDVFTYTYDADGNQLTAQDVSGTYTMTYDALDRVISTEDPFGLTLTYTYDADGNRIETQDSLGGVTTYIYDADNELTSEQFGGTGQIAAPDRHDLRRPRRVIDRDPLQRPGRRRRSWSNRTTPTTATARSRTCWTATAPARSWPTSRTPTTSPTGCSPKSTWGMTTTYTYDADNQLTSEDSPLAYDRLQLRRQRQSQQWQQRRRPQQPAHSRRRLELYLRRRRQHGPAGRRVHRPRPWHHLDLHLQQ